MSTLRGLFGELYSVSTNDLLPQDNLLSEFGGVEDAEQNAELRELNEIYYSLTGQNLIKRDNKDFKYKQLLAAWIETL